MGEQDSLDVARNGTDVIETVAELTPMGGQSTVDQDQPLRLFDEIEVDRVASLIAGDLGIGDLVLRVVGAGSRLVAGGQRLVRRSLSGCRVVARHRRGWQRRATIRGEPLGAASTVGAACCCRSGRSY
ncbi:hypothetical protein ACFPFX_34665 [Streptomyces mauvecolor]|uniref:Uncharacterized protein n=1 Tax=Streptomyces mauvecolor TaxID=58345 RepID=A0ABV9UY21_9ACTN